MLGLALAAASQTVSKLSMSLVLKLKACSVKKTRLMAKES